MEIIEWYNTMKKRINLFKILKCIFIYLTHMSIMITVQLFLSLSYNFYFITSISGGIMIYYSFLCV